MTISPHHVAAVFLSGGLITGSYFAYQILVPPNLEDYLNNTLKLRLISENNGWTAKAKNYLKPENNIEINSIKKSAKEDEIATALQTWCNKKKSTYFWGNKDDIYKKFSIWCLVTQKIEDALKSRGLTLVTGPELTKKFQEYTSSSQTFLNKDKAVEKDLSDWCNIQKVKEYKYEGDEDLEKTIKWCYFESK